MANIATILLDLASVECTTKEGVETLETVIKQITAHYKKQQERLDKLIALEAAGVDNWEGYDVAMRSLYSEEDDAE